MVHNAGVIRPALLPEVQARRPRRAGRPAPRLRDPAGAGGAAGDAQRSASAASCCCRRARRSACRRAPLLGDQGRHARAWRAPGRSSWRRDGITVNVVAPGPIRTDMFYEVVDEGSEKERKLAASIPVRRLGEADDVARAVRSSPTPPTASSPARCCTSAAAPASAAWRSESFHEEVFPPPRSGGGLGWGPNVRSLPSIGTSPFAPTPALPRVAGEGDTRLHRDPCLSEEVPPLRSGGRRRGFAKQRFAPPERRAPASARLCLEWGPSVRDLLSFCTSPFTPTPAFPRVAGEGVIQREQVCARHRP